MPDGSRYRLYTAWSMESGGVDCPVPPMTKAMSVASGSVSWDHTPPTSPVRTWSNHPAVSMTSGDNTLGACTSDAPTLAASKALADNRAGNGFIISPIGKVLTGTVHTF